MEDSVIIHEWQKVTSGDLNNMGAFPRKTFDDIQATQGPGTTYSGFNVAVNTNSSVKVSNGILTTLAGPLYYNNDDGGTVIDLLDLIPSVTRRCVAIGVWGEQKETDIQPRTFLSDAETRVAVGKDVATRSTRRANVGRIATSPEGPDPARPAEPAGTLIVAYVFLGTGGVESIEPVVGARTPSLKSHEARLNENDGWRTRAGTRLDTLGTDIAGLAGQIQGTASLAFVLRMAADLARAKEALKIPSTYAAYGSDHYLVQDQSDTTHVDFLAKVEEGIRFPNAAERVAQIGLMNPLDPKVRVQNNFMLPDYDELTRVSVLEKDAEMSISQYQFQNVTWKQLQKTRTRIRYGTPFFACSNGVWWYDAYGTSYLTSTTRTSVDNVGGVQPNVDLIYDPIKNIYTRQSTGETFQVLNVQVDNPEHYVLRLVQFWVDEIPDGAYWDRTVTTEGLNGSVLAQTFLNAQGGWLTSVEIPFTRIGAAGSVHCLICETVAGVPMFDRILGRATVDIADLKALPALAKFKFVPIYLQKGARFGIFLQTTGNHFVSVSKNNKFANGSLFQTSDLAASVASIDTDMNFQLNFASFKSNRVEVDLLGVELSGGIAAIDLNYDSISPGQTITQFQIRIGSTWVPLAAAQANPLNALPPLLPFRVVLTGTADEMPGIGLGVSGLVTTSRPRSDFRHISKAYIPGGTISTVIIEVRLEAWRGAPYHTHVCKLLTGASYATVVNATLQSEKAAPDDPQALIRTYRWTGLNITAFKIRQEGLTDNVLSVFHVADRVYTALT